MSGLDQIDIKLEGIGHVVSDNSLSVPRYQRSYAWEERQVGELFQDIATAIGEKEKEYFLGSIVVMNEPPNRPEVVDGQQRLATTSILLCAIRDYFYKNGDRTRADDIENKYLVKRDLRTQEKVPRLQLNESDHDFYQKRVLSRPDDKAREIAPQKNSHKRLAHALTLAERHVESVVSLSNKPGDKLIDWVEYIELKARVIMVRVPDYANAFTIFETLNDRGLDLAISDLLKNYLFHLSGDRINEAQQRWVSMFATLEAIEGEDIIVDYIRHLWSSKNGITREKDLFDKIKKNITSKQIAIDFSNELASSARLYAAILNTDHEIWTQYGQTARGHMTTLNLMGMVQIRPLLLAVLDKFTDKEVQCSLRLLVSWAARFLVVGGLGGGTLETHYSQRAKEVRDGSIKHSKDLMSAMLGVVPPDSQFLASFSVASVSKSSLARYYLRALEKQAKNEKDPELVPNPNEEEVNLEHILPQNPSTQWSGVDAETAKSFYRRLGNLALLKSQINSQVGSDGFKDKVVFYKKSNFLLTSGLSQYTSWGTREIEERQKKLAELAVKAWPLKI